MKSIVISLMLIATFFSAVAQDVTDIPGYDKAPAVLKAKREAKMMSDIMAHPQPNTEPVDSLNLLEFQTRRAELVGQVIELRFDRVNGFKQMGMDGAEARVTFEKASMDAGVDIAVPMGEGFELFQEMFLLEKDTLRVTDVYVQVLAGSTVKALGTRYRSGADDGEHYSW